jgi:hypothetical protein
MSAAERRHNYRMDMAVAVRVQGYLPGGASWEEMTQTDDVSTGGTSFTLKHSVELGQVLHLTLALPKRLRQHDLGDAVYHVYSLVRGISRRTEEYRVGVMFFGKFPPRGFQKTPWARFLLPSDSATLAVARGAAEPAPSSDTAPASALPEKAPPEDAPSADGLAADRSTAPSPFSPDDSSVWENVPLPASVLSFTPPLGVRAPVWFTPLDEDPPPSQTAETDERRSHPRFQMFLNFTIQQVDEWGAVLQEELTVADNLSRGGAHVKTTLDFSEGDVVLLQEAGGGFATRAAIRAVVEGPDGIARLHLKFLDRQAPDRLLKG